MKAVYFIGAGGIGMSAIARYFLRQGLCVAGYDKTPSKLTAQLEQEGMLIHYEDNVSMIPQQCLDPKETLVVYTPCRVESICLLAAVNSSIVYFMFSPLTSDFFVKSEYTTEL